MNVRNRLAWTWAVVHLLFVARGALGWAPPDGLPARAWAAYDALTGSGNSYGFFAPAVASMPRARVVVLDASGSPTTLTLPQARGREFDLRVGASVGMLWWGHDAHRRALASSWAAAALATPDAVAVLVFVELFEVPSMAEYRAGARPHWRLAYEAEFHRRSMP
jgi:hypothetical protein